MLPATLSEQVPLSPPPVFPYKAFISYKQKAGWRLAGHKPLETALEQFSKKWYQRRAFDVFRDATSLGASAGLWKTLKDSLQNTEFYILLASPEATASDWVRDELNHWLDSRGCEHFLIVLTSGQITWDKAARDFDWTKTTALNRGSLAGKFSEEPLWVDCSWARDLDELKIKRAMNDLRRRGVGDVGVASSQSVQVGPVRRRPAPASSTDAAGANSGGVAFGLVARRPVVLERRGNRKAGRGAQGADSDIASIRRPFHVRTEQAPGSFASPGG